MNRKEKQEKGALFEIPYEQMEIISHDLTNADAGKLAKALFMYFEMTYGVSDDRAELLSQIFKAIVEFNEGND